MIGIGPKVNNQNTPNFFREYGYFINCYDGYIYSKNFEENCLFVNKLPIGTLITMIVDTNAGKLSYRINDGIIITAFHSLTFSEPIYPYVLFMTKGDVVKIIHE